MFRPAREPSFTENKSELHRFIEPADLFLLLHDYIHTFWRETLIVIQPIGKVCRAVRVEMRLQQSLKKMNPHSAAQMNSQNGLLHP